ncbi:MAG: Adenine specific DNA methylase Mod, partial [Desulfotomaculum sp. 46_296]
MDKMRFESPDLTARNIDNISAMFPGVVTEGKVNFDLLRSLLGDEVYGDEAYEFTWVGKRAAIAEAGRPIRKTLRPCVEESKNWDTTENLYIEGDNLDVLKLLQESYLGKVKMIYIDPPYNTGNDFVYRDNFTRDKDEYDEEAGIYDEDGDRLFRNTGSNGRFHSDWCSMMYPRLVLARNLLAENGVIFISISEEEVATLKALCNEVFGESNFRNAIFTRRYDKNINRQFMEQGLSTMNTGFEYILMYSKTQITKYNPVFRESSETRSSTGYWKGFWNDADRPTMRYEVLGVTPDSGQWKWRKELAGEAVQNYNVFCDRYQEKMTLEDYWEKTGKNKKFIRRNVSGKGKNQGVEHWVAPAVGILRNTNWSDLLASKPTGVDVPFDSPKNTEVIIELLRLSNIDADGVAIDFFSGSATTAHAVMQLNAEDSGKRKFIMVQLPEPCAPDSEAAKAGYANICEIGKERIRRAGEKINAEFGMRNAELKKREQTEPNNSELRIPHSELDTGFRVLKLDDTNMKDVY